MRVVALANGAPPPDRSTDFVGDDPQGAFAASARAADAALRAEGALDKPFPTLFGEVPGKVFAGTRYVDVVIHTWDLARATGQPPNLDPALCEVALTMSRARMAGAERKPGGPIGPEVAVPDDAPVCDRLAGYLGRQV
jgi:uncharacterized protein (TIGR03086 family)